MEAKKCLVVYYSRSGNTRKVAEAIAEGMGADIEEIVDRKKRSGFFGVLGAGWDAMRKKLTDIAEPQKDPGDYDVVVLGTPVWAGTICPAVRTWITNFRERLPAVALFATTGASGIDRTLASMATLCGKEPAARLGLTEAQLAKAAWKGPVSEFAREVGAGGPRPA